MVEWDIIIQGVRVKETVEYKPYREEQDYNKKEQLNRGRQVKQTLF